MTVLNTTITAFSMTWDPGLRGIAVVVVGTVVLVGSVYLLLGTNLGSRLGFLVAVAGLSAWMMMMGIVWAMYGIGYKGTAPHWKVEEVVTSAEPRDLSASKLAAAHDLSSWTELSAESPARGEAQATASAALTGAESRVKLFESDSEFQVIDAYTKGGKTKSFINNWVPGPHPPHYSIVQVQGLVKVDVEFGATPPTPRIDTSAPIQSVILVRDLGKLRLPSVLITLASAIVFGLTCSALHRRDKAMWARDAAAPAPVGA